MKRSYPVPVHDPDKLKSQVNGQNGAWLHKQNTFSKLSVVLIFSTMIFMIFSCVSSQTPFFVKGNGPLVDKNFNIGHFQEIEVSSGFDVNLVQGDTEGVTLSVQENLYPYIVVNVENGILKIYAERNFMQTAGMKARIMLKSINGLRVSGGGDVSSETGLDLPNLAVDISGGGDFSVKLKTGDMKCSLSGGGDVKIDGIIRNFDMNMSGGGDIQSMITSQHIRCSISGGGDMTLQSGEKAEDADVSVSGGGDVNMSIFANLVKCSLSGGGDASLSGEANILDISVNGGGDINAGSLKAQTARFSANGGSDVHIQATAEIAGNISGGGNLYYSGNPGKIDIDAKGGSEVKKE